MLKKLHNNPTLALVIAVSILVVFRFILLGALPLLDKTEARYSEIARLMYETKEWVVLQIEYGIPFWAKPPLSTWLSALSFKVFGINEISARLPSFLLNLFLIILLGKYIIKEKKRLFLLAFILLTTPEFFLHTGVVSTDTALCFSVSLIMIGFWKAMNDPKPLLWNYLFFVGIGLGFLSKGPLVLVLTGPPIFIWLIIKKIKIKDLLYKLPWLLGILLVALIAVPWYYLAELRSPGFFDYFIVGEHFKRFLEPGWTGDLYGSGHSQPLGMIWVFLFAFAFPWFQILILKLWKVRKTILKNSWVVYLLLWILWTPFFFTFSSNILHTYILPSTVPLALLVIHYWPEFKRKDVLYKVAAVFPVLSILFFIGIRSSSYWEPYLNTDKYLIRQTHNDDDPVFYWQRTSYSGAFYTKGKSERIDTEEQLDSIVRSRNQFYLLTKNKDRDEIPEVYRNRMKLLDSNYRNTVFRFDKTIKP
ncbi:MAG: glycosyltransferase family 39 protein [Flavobacteriaceae bacterium]|nr:glycosyltransferase family 39 protein [Flavobacteriaceae bacterium]